MRQIDFLGNVKTALSIPTTEQGVEHRDCPAALCVVTVPNGVPAGMHDGRRRGLGHFTRGLADHFGADAGFGDTHSGVYWRT